jgi:hypothetical protein
VAVVHDIPKNAVHQVDRRRMDMAVVAAAADGGALGFHVGPHDHSPIIHHWIDQTQSTYPTVSRLGDCGSTLLKNFSPPWEDGPSCEEQAGADGIGGVVAAAGSAVLGTGAAVADMGEVAAEDGPQNDGGHSAAARAMAISVGAPPFLAEDNQQPVVACTRNYEKYVDTQKHDVF